MELSELQKHIATLVTLPETRELVISCYLNAESGAGANFAFLDERARVLRKCLAGPAGVDFDGAFSPILEYLRGGAHPPAKGLAIFSRGGASPFFLPLAFQVALPDWMAVNSLPNIYHLVELKDTYDRYVVFFATEEQSRILAVNLGSVTQQILHDRPELRERLGRGWTREHYQRHREECTNRFIREEIEVLDRLMSSRGYGRLILAGSPRMTARVERMLPKHLARKLVDTVHASGGISDVVAATLVSFVENGEAMAAGLVTRLEREVRTQGLAVAGTLSTARALEAEQADVLVMAKAYVPEPGWMCGWCEARGWAPLAPGRCPRCGAREFMAFDIREEMVRLAEREQCRIEIVAHSDLLMRLGGVGCLLRYLEPDAYRSRLYRAA
jgi:rubrerythrin